MGFQLEFNLSALTVFLQGILSFLSPCVLPLLPLYLGYLSGGAGSSESGQKEIFRKGKVMVNTLFFVAGIGFTFFLLGIGASALGQFFSRYHIWFARIGGIIVILFGLYQLGVFRLPFLAGEHRLSLQPGKFGSGPLAAFILGFTFSFSWTPCIGPTLASVLLMAGSSSDSGLALLYIGIYTAGFCIPFLLVGLFTTNLLNFFKKNRRIVQYTVKAGGILMIAMGIFMVTGWMSGLSTSLAGTPASGVASRTEASAPSPETSPAESSSSDISEETESAAAESSEAASQEPRELPDAPDFSLTDQNGATHAFSDYNGKTVFLNFWATWCPPCKSELGHIQSLYEDWEENAGDLAVLTVVSPNVGQEGDVAYITDFLEENGYTFPVLMDETGMLSYQYGVTALPTTFMITDEGKVYGYVPGAMTRDIMDMIVEQTMEGQSQTAESRQSETEQSDGTE